MNKLKVIITKGLPASGKSSWADQYIKENPDFVKIEKDIIRQDGRLFPGGEYIHKRGDESIVLKERDRLIRQALQSGKSVISSDTNLVKKHVSQMSTIARQHGAEVEIVSFLDVPLKELIERDTKRQDAVGEQVIRKMFHTQVGSMPTFLKEDPNLPYVVVCDLDGTLTKGPKDRSPYEWDKVGQDDINLGTSAILDGLRMIGLYDIYIFSGRNEVCRPETEEWLERHDIEYEKLVMRPQFLEDGVTENNLSDEIIKANMIEEHIVGQKNVLLWLDDRDRVSTMLRDVYGINVAQFGDTRYKF
jgi:predicted kinase